MTFPRRSRFRREEKFAPMELTARDAEILRSVHRHRFLRSHQIAELVGGSRQQVLRRLQKLYHHGYLERPVCQLDYYQRAGSRSIAYGLASRGAAHLRRTENIPFSRLDWTSRNRAVKRLFLEHALMVSDIMVTLELACRKRGDVQMRTGNDLPVSDSTGAGREPFRWTVTVSEKERLGVIPDRIFMLEFTGNKERILCCLEADTGTMPIRRSRLDSSCFERKFVAYEATWRQRIHSARFGSKRLRVLAVTDNEQRLGHLRGVCASRRAGDGIFLFSTRMRIANAADAFVEPWINAPGESAALTG